MSFHHRHIGDKFHISQILIDAHDKGHRLRSTCADIDIFKENGIIFKGSARYPGRMLRQSIGYRQSCEVNTSPIADRSEEHTSELQSRGHIVCRLLLEKKKSYDFKLCYFV